jgi:hypothetical protein
MQVVARRAAASTPSEERREAVPDGHVVVCSDDQVVDEVQADQPGCGGQPASVRDVALGGLRVSGGVVVGDQERLPAEDQDVAGMSAWLTEHSSTLPIPQMQAPRTLWEVLRGIRAMCSVAADSRRGRTMA